MLFDPDIETKSAQPRARRYRPKRTTGDRVREALLMLAEGRANLLSHEEKAWSSITFTGTRHEVVLDFDGNEAVEVGEHVAVERSRDTGRVIVGCLEDRGVLDQVNADK